MIKIIDKHPYIFGFVLGVAAARLLRKQLQKYLEGKITIIQLQIVEKDIPEGKKDPVTPLNQA